MQEKGSSGQTPDVASRTPPLHSYWVPILSCNALTDVLPPACRGSFGSLMQVTSVGELLAAYLDFLLCFFASRCQLHRACPNLQRDIIELGQLACRVVDTSSRHFQCYSGQRNPLARETSSRKLFDSHFGRKTRQFLYCRRVPRSALGSRYTKSQRSLHQSCGKKHMAP